MDTSKWNKGYSKFIGNPIPDIVEFHKWIFWLDLPGGKRAICTDVRIRDGVGIGGASSETMVTCPLLHFMRWRGKTPFSWSCKWFSDASSYTKCQYRVEILLDSLNMFDVVNKRTDCSWKARICLPTAFITLNESIQCLDVISGVGQVAPDCFILFNDTR